MEPAEREQSGGRQNVHKRATSRAGLGALSQTLPAVSPLRNTRSDARADVYRESASGESILNSNGSISSNASNTKKVAMNGHVGPHREGRRAPKERPTVLTHVAKPSLPEVIETHTVSEERGPDGHINKVNSYELVRHLGEGSTGAEVKLFKLSGTNELFAVKILSRQSIQKRGIGGRRKSASGAQKKSGTHLPEGAANVLWEIAIMKQIAHPNIVKLIEVIDDPAAHLVYAVMEYVDGGVIMEWDADIDQFVSPKTKAVLSEVQAATFFLDIISGLEYLHSNFIAHRDLKPENILLTESGQAKLTDFGVAYFFEEERLRSPRMVADLARSKSRAQLMKTAGTWSFWSPEMCQGDGQFNAYAADLWAAAVTLWCCMFGRPPFHRGSPLELFEAIANEKAEVPPEASPMAANLLANMLEKDVNNRLTLAGLRSHPWVMHHTNAVMEKKHHPAVKLTERDLANAIQRGMSFRFADAENGINAREERSHRRNITAPVSKVAISPMLSCGNEPDMDNPFASAPNSPAGFTLRKKAHGISRVESSTVCSLS